MRVSKTKKVVASAIAMALTLGSYGASATSYEDAREIKIKVDLSTTYQTIHSFGASDAWVINPLIKKWEKEGNEEAIEHLGDLLFSIDKGIGLTSWRFNVGAGSAEQGKASKIKDELRRAELLIPEPFGEVDKTKQLGQLRLLQEASERGVEQYIAFNNSPPVWATKNGLAYPNAGTKYGDVGTTNLDPNKLDAFIDFEVKVLKYLQNELKIPVNNISPVNEPTWDWEGGTNQEANRYNVKELKTLYKGLYEALKKENLTTPVYVDGPEVVEYTAALSDEYKVKLDGSLYTGGMNNRDIGTYKNYINEFLGDPEMRKVLNNKISVHGYYSDHEVKRLQLLRTLMKFNIEDVSPDAQVWMSEMSVLGGTGDVRDFEGHGFDADDMDYAIHIARIANQDLMIMNASAWSWWIAVTPYDYKDGLLKVNADLEADSLQESKAFWALGHFSRFVRPGYTRVKTSEFNNLSGLMTSSYMSPDGSKLVTVMINASDTETFNVNLVLDGHKTNKLMGKTSAYITNQDHNMAPYKGAKIEPKSIMTVVKELL